MTLTERWIKTQTWILSLTCSWTEKETLKKHEHNKQDHECVHDLK